MNGARWIAAFGYACLVWSSAGWARLPVDWLRRHNLLRVTLAALALGTVAIVAAMLRRRGRVAAWRMMGLAALAAVYGLAVTGWAGTHEERIHFLEYGIAAVLFARALAPNVRNRPLLFLTSVLFGAGAGVIDELVQRVTPGRFCDAHDMAINAASALLGVLLYATAGGAAFTGASPSPPEKPSPPGRPGSRMDAMEGNS